MTTTDDDLNLYMGDPPDAAPVPGSTVRTICKVAPRHEQIINWFIANPHRKNSDCAAFFGVTQAWLSTIKRSDAYQARMRQRLDEMAGDVREEFIEQMGMGMLGKLSVAADLALDKLTEKIEAADDPEYLLDCTDKLLHRMGFAPKSTPVALSPQTVNNNTLNVNVSAGDLAEARQLLGNTMQALSPPASLVAPETLVIEGEKEE